MPASPNPKGRKSSKKVPPPVDRPQYVVGIGASAGGLEALRSFFATMPADSGMAFVVIQHLAPDHKSLMVELLARATNIPVARAEEGMVVEANRIYLIPPRFNLTIEGGTLHLIASPGGKALNLPIDLFFRSLAREAAERAVAVILSGTGSDGARGIRAVKEAGGMIMVQDEASAKFAGMPSSAIATGAADFILPVEAMPEQLINFSRHPFAKRGEGTRAHIPENSTQVERVCIRLKEVTGIDFSHYKHATFSRRIERRMNIAQLQDIHEYVQCLMQSGREAEALGKDLLIGVTKFFRDSESFGAFSRHLEKLFDRTPPHHSLRLWSAACSTGEEAYTLAMLCEEIRTAKYPLVEYKVFATDVDKQALEIAGAGVYPRSVVADLPDPYLERYFQVDGAENFRINRALRDRLIFARQDLLADPPFTKIDALCCRNLLIYLRPEAQSKLLSLFHFSLVNDGVLLLGSSETLGDLDYAFEPLDNKNRIHRKAAGVNLRMADSIPSLDTTNAWSVIPDGTRGMAAAPRSRNPGADAIQQHLLQRFAPATLVLNRNCQLLYTTGPIGPYLQMPAGPANFNALKMVPRDLGLAISTAVNQALRDEQPVEFRAIRFTGYDGQRSTVRLQAEAFDTGAEQGRVTLITIQPDEKTPLATDADGEPFDRERQFIARIATLEQELQNTRDNLQASVEQQETANEELQAANEELLASNEELQSTNEELESVNEELYTVNAEYQGKIQELTELDDDMQNFARSTEIGTIFLDADLRIRRFTSPFEKLTGLAEVDCGRHLSTFAHPVLARINDVARKLATQTALRHEEVIDLHQSGMFMLRVTSYRRVNDDEYRGIVASLVDISRIADSEETTKGLLNAVDLGICITDERGRLVQVNQAYCRIYGYREEELIGQPFTIVLPKSDHESAMKLHDDFIQKGMELPALWNVIDKQGRAHRIAVRAGLVNRSDGTRRKITVVTDLIEIQRLLNNTESSGGQP